MAGSIASKKDNAETMPQLITRSALITQYVKDRAVLEVELCKDLYGIYNQAPILPQVQETIAFAFENVAALVLLPSKGPIGAKNEALQEGQILKVFVKHGGGIPKDHDLGDKCKKVLSNYTKWDAADCSDLSRLIGSVLEKSGTGHTQDTGHTQFDHERSTYKPDEFYKNNPDKLGRSRRSDSSYTNSKDMSPTKAGRNAGLDARMKTFWSGQEDPSGISPFKLTQYSTVRKIDVAFGLPEGADISGTTSDSIITNQMTGKFCAEIQAGPPATTKLLQLLPLVTMVSHGHHTLVESALTLTLFGVCNYQIGFYTSLISGPDGRSAVGGEILRVLQKYEADKRNRHILCFYDTKSQHYMAHEYASPDEVSTYRRFATTSEGFLKYFRDHVHAQVYEGDLTRLVTGQYKDVKRVRI